MTAGAATFAAKGCAGCHGANGSGGAFTSLYGRTAADLQDAITGVSLMANFSSLTETEILDLGAYMTSLTPPTPVGDATRGAATFAAKGCAGCHGANGVGGAFTALDGRTAADLRTAITSVSLMANFSSLTEAEILDLGAFMTTIQPATPAGNATNGQALYTSKNCTLCHGANRQGGAGPALTAAALTPKYAAPSAMVAKIKTMNQLSPAATDAEALDIATFLLQ